MTDPSCCCSLILSSWSERVNKMIILTKFMPNLHFDINKLCSPANFSIKSLLHMKQRKYNGDFLEALLLFKFYGVFSRCLEMDYEKSLTSPFHYHIPHYKGPGLNVSWPLSAQYQLPGQWHSAHPTTYSLEEEEEKKVRCIIILIKNSVITSLLPAETTTSKDKNR